MAIKRTKRNCIRGTFIFSLLLSSKFWLYRSPINSLSQYFSSPKLFHQKSQLFCNFLFAQPTSTMWVHSTILVRIQIQINSSLLELIRPTLTDITRKSFHSCLSNYSGYKIFYSDSFKADHVGCSLVADDFSNRFSLSQSFSISFSWAIRY